MFAKLLKHEWKASFGLLSILSLAALSVGALGAVVLRVLFTYEQLLTDSDSPYTAVLFVLVMLLFFLYIALIAYGLGTQLLLLYRFYKRKFTDEGYLTFTLPVNVHQIFLSSILNMMMWSVISLVVIAAALLIAVLFGTTTTGLINYQMLDSLKQAMGVFARDILSQPGVMPYIILFCGLMVVSFLYSTVIPMTCVVIGAVVAKKHKLLAAFGIYYGTSFLVGILSAVLVSAVMIFSLSGTGSLMFEGIFMAQIVLQLCLTVGAYFMSTYLMRKKLNLP